jgi:hypothetical protein
MCVYAATQGCRLSSVEGLLRNTMGKKVIFLLNKVDLVPAQVAEQVRAACRRSFVALCPFVTRGGVCAVADLPSSRGTRFRLPRQRAECA